MPAPAPPAAELDAQAAGAPHPDDAMAAVQVIIDYYAAIQARDYRRAYEMWGDGGRASGRTYEQFAAGFGETAQTSVTVGHPDREEGAAGSRYVEVPVVVNAVTTTGATQRFEGEYTLRRVVVDGATEEQRRWHIVDGDLDSDTD